MEWRACRRETTHIDIGESPELHPSAPESAEGVFDIEGEPDALAQKELAGEDLLGMFPTKRLDETNNSL